MPTYTYKCTKCGYRFDQFQHFADDPLELCPNCQKLALRKVYTPVGIVFKGKGFYATDNRSPSGMTSQKTESSESSKASESEKNGASEAVSKAVEKAAVTESAKAKATSPSGN